MTEIEWKEPPVDRRRSSDYAEIADTLRSRPGEWALVFKDSSLYRQPAISTARARAFAPAGSFEARSVPKGDGTYDIYARYVGEAAS